MFWIFTPWTSRGCRDVWFMETLWIWTLSSIRWSGLLQVSWEREGMEGMSSPRSSLQEWWDNLFCDLCHWGQVICSPYSGCCIFNTITHLLWSRERGEQIYAEGSSSSAADANLRPSAAAWWCQAHTETGEVIMLSNNKRQTWWETLWRETSLSDWKRCLLVPCRRLFWKMKPRAGRCVLRVAHPLQASSCRSSPADFKVSWRSTGSEWS